jgi:hypothetical protein
MQNLKNKTFSILIVAILSIAMTSIAIPAVNAVDYPTYAFLAVAPSPVGVGQQVQITMWVDLLPARTAYSGQATATWKGYILTITSPSGNVETKTMNSDPVASQYVSYTPTEAGNYILQFTYPGEIIGNFTILGSKSPNVTLTVQEEPIAGVPQTPLPEEYWTRPINAQNRDWYTISNNWYGVPILFGNTWAGGSNWLPVGSAPNTAHVLWSTEKDLGGLIGGELGDVGYYSGASYENKWTPPVIINGRLYYNQRLGGSSNLGLVCRDLDTGEQLWFQNGTTITCGQVLEFDSPNQHGAFPYLWSIGTTCRMYDPLTGTEILQIVNATTGRIAFDKQGNLLFYILNGAQNQLTLWNATKCIQSYYTGATPEWYWRPTAGLVADWKRGIMWNVSVPDVPGSQGIASMGENTIVAAAQAATNVIGVTGYSTQDGRQLFNFNVSSTETYNYFFSGEVDGKFAWFKQEAMQSYGYDATTGAQLWVTDPYTIAWGMYTSSVDGLGASSPVIAYGKLYTVAYDGMIHCYDMETGNNDWNYYIGNSGYETPYGTWPFGGGLHVAADGKIYATTGEHSPSHPLTRGAKLVCINATTGEEIWRTQGWMQTPVIADGSLTAFNHYDNRIYCFNKGPTAITVSAPDIEVAKPTRIMIKGTVTDISPGTNGQEQAMRFPNGVPAVSDASMTDWMAYVYQQQPKPTNTTGVPVSIDVIDGNGNYRNIGSTTTDAEGFYSVSWTPDIAGTYTVIASFTGSQSYWPSHSKTAFIVADTAPTQPPTTAAPESAADMYFIPAVAGIIVAIIIVGAILALLLLRKRP